MAKAELDLVANVKGALKSINTFQERTTKAVEGVEKSFNALKVVAAGAVGFLAGRELVQGLTAVTRAAAAQQDAVNNLNTALRQSGEFSEQTSRELQDFASALQDATGIGDELTLQNLALAQSFGASAEQAKLIVTAAGDLAAATGKSLDEAVRQVSKTLGGFAGELGEVNPAIKELTQEELRNGEAARVLLDQYGGFAAAQLNTFSGSVDALQGRFGDLLESIGEIITENPAIIKAFKILDQTIVSLTRVISDNQGAFSKVVSTITFALIDSIDDTLRAVAFLFEGFGKLLDVLVAVSKALGNLAKSFLNSRTAILNLEGALDGITAIFKTLGVGVVSVTEAFLRLNQVLNLFGQGVQLDNVFDTDTAIENLARLRKTLSEDITKSFTDGTDSAEGLLEKIKEITDTTIEVGDAGSTAMKTLADGVRDVADEAEKTANSLANIEFVGPPEPGQEGGGGKRESEFGKNLSDAGAEFGKKFAESFAKNVQAGAEGAKPFVVDTLTAGVAAIAGAFGGPAAAEIAAKIAGPIFQILSAGPDAVKEQVRAFAEAVPVVVDALAEAAPVFIIALAENADRIIVSLIQALPKLVLAIIQSLPEIVRAFANLIARSGKQFREDIQRTAVEWREQISESLAEFGAVFSNIGKVFIEQFGAVLATFGEVFQNIGDAFGASISDAVKGAFENIASFFDPLIGLFDPLVDFSNSIASLISKIEGITGGGGENSGISGAFDRGRESAEDFFGLAGGGTIPSGFPNDSFSAGLTSGEMVVPSDDVDRLSAFLDDQAGGGSDQPVQITLQIGEKQLADVILNLNRQGFRVA